MMSIRKTARVLSSLLTFITAISALMAELERRAMRSTVTRGAISATMKPMSKRPKKENNPMRSRYSPMMPTKAILRQTAAVKKAAGSTPP